MQAAVCAKFKLIICHEFGLTVPKCSAAIYQQFPQLFSVAPPSLTTSFDFGNCSQCEHKARQVNIIEQRQSNCHAASSLSLYLPLSLPLFLSLSPLSPSLCVSVCISRLQNTIDKLHLNRLWPNKRKCSAHPAQQSGRGHHKMAWP